MSQRRAIRVVIAEDIPETSDLIGRLLEMQGYVVAGKAANGLQAVEVTRTVEPDVVLMDVAMPGIDGIEATRRIQACCPTPVVILSVYKEPDVVRRAGEAGAGAYLVKPPSSDEMQRAITVALARFDDMTALRQANDRLQAEVQARTVAEESLRWRLKIEQLVSGVSAALVQIPSGVLDQEIVRALQKVAELAGADRSFFFSLVGDGARLENAHEWCAPSIGSRIRAMAQPDARALGWWAARLAEFEPICLPNVAALAPGERVSLDPPPCPPGRSLVAVPLVLAGSRNSFFGFDAVKAGRAWGSAEILMLTVVGEILARALERRQTEERLARADRMAFVGQVAGAIAHEMRNPLGIIAANSDLLQKQAIDGDLAAECARRIAAATRRASLALDKLLNTVEPRGQEDPRDEH